MSKNVAIVMAAGQGTRVGGQLPKQFISVRGKMLVEYSLSTFQQHPLMDEILMVVPAGFELEKAVYLKNKYAKLSEIVTGGAERFQSSWAAVQRFVNRPDDVLLLHDAARPLLPARVIDDLVSVLQSKCAAVTALPATDTILQVSAQQILEKTLKRSELYYAQTPQAFKAALLCDCFSQMELDAAFRPTDESGLVSHFHPEIPIHIVEGDPLNFKVTFPEDVLRVERLCE